jgi:methionyl-tRNA formyltransferase
VPSHILLLTSGFEAAALRPVLAGHNPHCVVEPVEDLAELAAAAAAAPGEHLRLIAFCTAVIVPQGLLARCGEGAYNFHPGPPTYPGRYPSCWGSYFGATRFGATLHEMSARVDEGQIVAVEWFAVTPPIGHNALSDRAYRAVIELFRRYAPALANDPQLPVDPVLAWSGRKTRLADYEAMCVLPPDIDAAEFARRRRAFGEAPGARLAVRLHGCTFSWEAPGEMSGEES